MRRENGKRKGLNRLLVLVLAAAVTMAFSFTSISFAEEESGSSTGQTTESVNNVEENTSVNKEPINVTIIASVGSVYGNPLKYQFKYSGNGPSNGLSEEALLKSAGITPEENILPDDEKDENGNYNASRSSDKHGIYDGYPAKLVFSDDQKDIADKWTEDPEPEIKNTDGTTYYLYENGNTTIHLWIYPISISQEKIENVVKKQNYPVDPCRYYDGSWVWSGSRSNNGPDFLTIPTKDSLPPLVEGRDYKSQFAFTTKYSTAYNLEERNALVWHDTAEGMSGPGFVWQKIEGIGNYTSTTYRMYMINSAVVINSSSPVKYEGDTDPELTTKSMKYVNNNPNSFGLDPFSVVWEREAGEEPGQYKITGTISVKKPSNDEKFMSWENLKENNDTYSVILGDTTNSYIWIFANNGKFTIKKKSHIVYNSNTSQPSEVTSEGKWKPGEESEELQSANQLNFQNSGYTLTGWNTQADGKGTSYKPGETYKFTDADDEKDVTLYAQWKEYSSPNVPVTPSEEHKVIITPNNGDPDITQTVPDGGKAVEPEDLVKDGYKLDGWYTDSALTKPFDFSQPIKNDVHVYAKWTKTNTPVKPAKPASKKVIGILLPKVIAKGKNTQILTWTALKNVDGYFIYTNHCDEAEGRIPHPFKKVADYKASKARVFTQKNLKTYHNYKYYVAAYKIKNGKKVIVRNSVTVHSVCGNTSARSTNVKSVKVSKHAVTLKKGQAYRVKASISKVNKKRAFLDATHCGLLRYLTADSSIATVNYNTGTIKAKKAGKTTVYVLGVNGIRDKVVVTVK